MFYRSQIMKNNLWIMILSLLLVVFNPTIAKSATEPIYLYEGITVQDMAEALNNTNNSSGLNKVGEFLYVIKDSFVGSIGDIPTDMAYFLGASAKTIGIGKNGSARLLEMLNDARSSKNFDGVLRSFRLGVDSNALSNKFAEIIGRNCASSFGANALRKAGLTVEQEALEFLNQRNKK